MARLGVGQRRLRQRGVCEGQRAVMVISKTTNGAGDDAQWHTDIKS